MIARRGLLALLGGLPFMSMPQRPDQVYDPPLSGLAPSSQTGIFRKISIGKTVILSPSNDTSGKLDSSNIQGQLNNGFNVELASGTFYTNVPITLPAGSVLSGEPRGLGVPTDNYGVGGLALAASIIKPVAAFSGTAVLLATQPASTPEIGQIAIQGIGIDGSLLPANTVDGILTLGPVAALTIVNVTVWNMGGHGMRADLNSHNQPGNFWWVQFCKVADCGGNGYFGVGLSDCNFVACESSTNSGDGFRFQDAVNMRITGCKSEWNGGSTSAGFHFINTAGNGSYASLTGCTTEHNWTSGLLFTGAGPSNLGTILVTGYQSNADNRGAVAGTAAIQSTGFGGRVMVVNAKTDGATVYGASQTSSSFQMFLTASLLAGSTAATFDDASNSLALVSQDPIPPDPIHTISSGFPAGWTGSVNFKLMAEQQLVFINWQLVIAAGTVVANNQQILTSGSLPAAYRPPGSVFHNLCGDNFSNTASNGTAAPCYVGHDGSFGCDLPGFTASAAGNQFEGSGVYSVAV